MESNLPLSEIRRLLLKHRGTATHLKCEKGRTWQKSTTLVLRDIAQLANVDKRLLHEICRGETDFRTPEPGRTKRRDTLGPRVRLRLSRILILIEAGRITKTQYKHYRFHETAQVAPAAPRLRVQVGTSGPALTPLPPLSAPALPSFATVFDLKGRL